MAAPAARFERDGFATAVLDARETAGYVALTVCGVFHRSELHGVWSSGSAPQSSPENRAGR